MAKNDSKKKKKDDEPPDLAESLRTAFERTFQAYSEGAHSTGERTRAVIDEMAAAAARIRQTLQDARAADEIAGLRREVEALSQRVAALEAAKPAEAKPATRRSSTTARKPASRSTSKPATRSTGTRSRRSSSSSSGS
jgi:uncharacterized membrane protein YccC